MPDDLEFVDHHQHPTGGTRTGCRLRAPMVDLQVASAGVNDLGRTYACTVTAEEYRRREERGE